MAKPSDILSDDVKRKIIEIGRADILVGIPSYNNSATIGHVVKAVQAGLYKYFSDKRSILVNSDGGSVDNTINIVKDSGIDSNSILIHKHEENLYKIITPYQGIPGKGSAFRTIFEIARVLDVKACAVVDSDLRSITPEWIELLISPVLNDGFDFIAPYYLRHKYDGTITNSIIYPMTRMLYGKCIRQPIGGDFGFSGKLAEFFTEKDVWESDVARFGIDIWMTTTAVANGFKICQSFLGAKIHDPKDPAAALSTMLHQVVNSLFNLMEEYSSVWKKVDDSENIPTFGFVYTVGLEPVNVNLMPMIDKFKLGVKELSILYEEFLSPELLKFLSGMIDLPVNKFVFPDEIWVKILYDFAIACHKKIINTEHIIKSLTPLYLGKVASFVIESKDANSEEVEQRLESLCLTFLKEKPYLNKRWTKK
jgi:glucosylglycerate synthase